MECKNELICSTCVKKRKINCFICEVERPCSKCLDLITQKKKYATDFNMLKRKPANECYQMLPFYIDEYERKKNKIDFETTEEVLIEVKKTNA